MQQARPFPEALTAALQRHPLLLQSLQSNYCTGGNCDSARNYRKPTQSLYKLRTYLIFYKVSDVRIC